MTMTETAPAQDERFIITFPLDRPHLGLPMADGELGILVFGSGHTLELCVSLASCWDRRYGRWLDSPCPYEELVALHDRHDVAPIHRRLWDAANRHAHDGDPGWAPWRPSRIGGGRFRLTLSAGLRRAELDYATGAVQVHTDAGSLRLDLAPVTGRMLLEDPAGLVGGLQAVPMWEALEAHFAPRGYAPPVRLDEAGRVGWFQPLPADPGMYAVLQRTPQGCCLHAGLATDGIPSDLTPPDPQTVRAANAAWWTDYWQTVPRLRLPDLALEHFFRLALYKFAAATRPGGVPCALQGPWLEDYQVPPWSCDYHFNVNVQQVYGLAFPTGSLRHLLPLFDMLESGPYQQVMRRNARMMFGIDDGLLMFHALDDRGQQCGGIHTGAMLDFVCGGWTALMYWWHYAYGGDVDFLRTRGWPFMRGVMRTFEEALEERDGRLSLPLAISAEYGCIFKVEIDGRMCNQNTGRDPSNQLTCIHALANALIKASAVLGEAPKPIWLDIKARLPRFSTVNGHVAVWEGQDLDVSHRHHSHLSMIHPFDLTGELTAAERAVVDESVDHWVWRGMGQWSEWCYPWAAMIQARWGFRDAPARLLDIWRHLFLNESLATVYLPRFRGLTSHRREDMAKPKATSEIMQLDGTMAGATALIELLVHERGGIIYLFPGAPDGWADAAFEGVHLPGGVVIGAERRAGRLVRIRLRSAAAQTVRLDPGDGGQPREIRLETARELELAGV